MAAQEVTPTHSAYLELREERRAMEEGYRFLDEKRLILAAETDQTLKELDGALEELEREEALRVRRAAEST